MKKIIPLLIFANAFFVEQNIAQGQVFPIKQWDKTLGGGGLENFSTVVQTADGGYLIGGSSYSGISGDKSQASIGSQDFWIVKLDPAGIKQWDKTIGGSGNDVLRNLIQTSDGGYLLGGASSSGISGDKSQASRGGRDYWVVRLNSLGVKVWDKTIGGSAGDSFRSLAKTSDGGYILGGLSFSPVSGEKTQANFASSDFWVVKIDLSGNKQWDNAIGGDDEDFILSLQQTTDGGFILGGGSNSGLSGDKTEASRGGDDYWVVKLGPEILGMNELVTSFDISVFPNPSKGKFMVQIDKLTSPNVEIIICDIHGRKVLHKKFQGISNHFSKELSIPEANGLYFLEVKIGDQSIIRKLAVKK